MRSLGFALIVMAVPAHAATLQELLPGIYTNEEQVYFDKEAGNKTVDPWMGIRIGVTKDVITVQNIDGYGAVIGQARTARIIADSIVLADCIITFKPDTAGLLGTPNGAHGCGELPFRFTSAHIDSAGMRLTHGDEQVATLRRARPTTCWGTVPKTRRKADGSEDWLFVAGLKLHDQGGRALFGGGDTGAPPVIIRMRNVVWPSGTNKPSLVLYVHKPKNPDHAESYSWADPEAKRIGINLRWMQASCSIDGK